MIIARDLGVRYPGTEATALDRVDLTLAPRELVVIAGPNGSGKTTLQRALLGLIPHTGTVTLDNRPLDQWPRQSIAESIGALPQREEPAFPLTVREAVLLGRWARLGPVAPVGREDERAAARAIERTDLEGLASRSIDTLSGGEWQRVRLARALASSPRFLLLDEPTAALDVSHEMEIFELLRSLVADGIGVMVITHQLNLAARFADRIMLLDHGGVAAAGGVTEVLQPDLLSKVFRWPLAILSAPDSAPYVLPRRQHDAASSQSPENPTPGQNP